MFRAVHSNPHAKRNKIYASVVEIVWMDHEGGHIRDKPKYSRVELYIVAIHPEVGISVEYTSWSALT